MEITTRVAIVLLAIASIVAVVLQLVNEKTGPIETTYEIITFLVAVVALTLTIAQGIYNTRTSNELKKIVHEMHEIMKLAEMDTRNEAELAKELGQKLKDIDKKA